MLAAQAGGDDLIWAAAATRWTLSSAGAKDLTLANVCRSPGCHAADTVVLKTSADAVANYRPGAGVRIRLTPDERRSQRQRWRTSSRSSASAMPTLSSWHDGSSVGTIEPGLRQNDTRSPGERLEASPWRSVDSILAAPVRYDLSDDLADRRALVDLGGRHRRKLSGQRG